MMDTGTSQRFLTDDEKEARKLIIEWARRRFCGKGTTPKIFGIDYDEEEFEWGAELEIEGWIDNLLISFYVEDGEVIITAGPDY